MTSNLSKRILSLAVTVLILLQPGIIKNKMYNVRKAIVKTVPQPIVKRKVFSTGKQDIVSAKPEHVQVSRYNDIPRTPHVFSISHVTVKELEMLLENTELKRYAYSFVKAEEVHGINALFLVSVAALESGWGTSYLANTYNNLFGFCAYDRNPLTAKKFSSKHECIMVVARYFKEKFGSECSIEDIGKIYASDPDWSKKVRWIYSGLVRRYLNIVSPASTLR